MSFFSTAFPAIATTSKKSNSGKGKKRCRKRRGCRKRSKGSRT